MDEKMLKIQEMIDRIESYKELIDSNKEELSLMLDEFRTQIPAAQKKFRWKDSWYLIKKRSGKFFIINYGDTEPGSWLKKVKDE